MPLNAGPGSAARDERNDDVGGVAVEDLAPPVVDGAQRNIAELAQQRDQVDSELAESVRKARAAHRSWSEIGAMLGVSKQAAQRKHGTKTPA